MLYSLVDRLCTSLESQPFSLGNPELAEAIRDFAPNAIESFRQSSRKEGKDASVETAMKNAALIADLGIKSVPGQARIMMARAQDRRVSAERRCAVASILAYLVQPHDLIPDDAPGGYGFLDDAIFIKAGLIEFLDTLPTPTLSADANARGVRFLIGMTPTSVRPAIQQGIDSMSQLVQMLSAVGPEIAEGALEQIVARPLEASAAVAAPPGFRARPARPYATGMGLSGITIDGNDVVTPEGPALIGGQLFIPD